VRLANVSAIPTLAALLTLVTFALNYVQRRPDTSDYVTTTMLTLLARMSKYGWFDNDNYDTVGDTGMRLLQVTPSV